MHDLAASAVAVEVVASSMEELQDPRGTDPRGRVLGIARTSYDMLGCARMFVNVLVNVHGQVLYNVTEDFHNQKLQEFNIVHLCVLLWRSQNGFVEMLPKYEASC